MSLWAATDALDFFLLIQHYLIIWSHRQQLKVLLLEVNHMPSGSEDNVVVGHTESFSRPLCRDHSAMRFSQI